MHTWLRQYQNWCLWWVKTFPSITPTLSCLLYGVSCSALQRIPFQLALPACTWPFCLSTLIFLLISSETPAICRLPLSVVSYPEENLRYQRQLKASAKAQQSQHGGSQEEAPMKESRESKSQPAEQRCCGESVWVEEMLFLRLLVINIFGLSSLTLHHLLYKMWGGMFSKCQIFSSALHRSAQQRASLSKKRQDRLPAELTLILTEAGMNVYNYFSTY